MNRIVFFVLLLCGTYANATETKIIIRAKAKDAKFVGSSLGGAYVVIRNLANQQILAEGKTTGTPGNTALVMKSPRERGEPLADEHTAKFLAAIDIDEPTFVRIEVTAPFNHRQSQVHATTELWLIPGKHLLGDGVIVEIPGFIVDILTPRTHNFIPLASISQKQLTVQANVVMMCGCLINKGGTWDSESMEVKAIVKKDGVFVKEVSMPLVAANLFEAKVDIASKGDYEFTVYAYSEQSGNTGVDKVNFVVH